MMFGKIRVFSVILICASLIFVGLFAALPKPADALTVRGPIHIIGNSAFTSANGVVSGTGTYADPYIIKGWDINAATNHGIWIEYTTAYFIVENCFVHGGAPNYHGIYLNQAYNGKIDNCESSWNLFGIATTNSGSQNHANTINNNYVHENWWTGIYLSVSNFTELDGNTVSNDGYGFGIYSSSNNTLTNNVANQNTNDGFYLDLLSQNNTLTNNQANMNNNGFFNNVADRNDLTDNTANNNNNGFYLYLTEYSVLTSNTANNNKNDGFHISNAEYNILTSNTATNNNNGFYLDYCNYNSLTGNTANNNKNDGFYIYRYSAMNVLTGNTANYNPNGFGFYIYFLSSSNVLTGNTATKNSYGFLLQNANLNILSGNSACLNVYGIVLDANSNYNNLASNQFQNNINDDWYNAGTGNINNYNAYTTHYP